MKIIDDCAFRDISVNGITIGRGVESISEYALTLDFSKKTPIFVHKDSYAEAVVRDISDKNGNIILKIIE